MLRERYDIQHTCRHKYQRFADIQPPLPLLHRMSTWKHRIAGVLTPASGVWTTERFKSAPYSQNFLIWGLARGPPQLRLGHLDG